MHVAVVDDDPATARAVSTAVRNAGHTCSRFTDGPTMALEVGPLRLCLANQRLTLAGKAIDLTPTEFCILELLMRFHGQVATRAMLCEHVWGLTWKGPPTSSRSTSTGFVARSTTAGRCP